MNAQTEMNEPESVEMRDKKTLEHLAAAEHHLTYALRDMPNSKASAFMSSDARDIAHALRRVQTVTKWLDR